MKSNKSIRRTALMVLAGAILLSGTTACDVLSSATGDGQPENLTPVTSESVAKALKTPVTAETKEQAQVALDKVDSIRLIEAEGMNTGYDRSTYPHWERVSTLIQKYPEAKKDWEGQLKGLPGGCTAREVMLIRQSVTKAEYDKYCKVTSGSWVNTYGLWDFSKATVTGLGTVITDKSGVDGDHVIPLAGSYRLGSGKWDLEKRTRFANDPMNIIIDDGPANRQKGDRLVDQWVPYNPQAACDYMVRYVNISVKYDLQGTQSIKDSLKKDLDRCVTEVSPQFMDLGEGE